MHSIAEIKAALSHMPAKEDLAVWRRDERKGVQRLLASYDKRCARMAAEKSYYTELLLSALLTLYAHFALKKRPIAAQ